MSNLLALRSRTIPSSGRDTVCLLGNSVRSRYGPSVRTQTAKLVGWRIRPSFLARPLRAGAATRRGCVNETITGRIDTSCFVFVAGSINRANRPLFLAYSSLHHPPRAILSLFSASLSLFPVSFLPARELLPPRYPILRLFNSLPLLRLLSVADSRDVTSLTIIVVTASAPAVGNRSDISKGGVTASGRKRRGGRGDSEVTVEERGQGGGGGKKSDGYRDEGVLLSSLLFHLARPSPRGFSTHRRRRHRRHPFLASAAIRLNRAFAFASDHNAS